MGYEVKNRILGVAVTAIVVLVCEFLLFKTARGFGQYIMVIENSRSIVVNRTDSGASCGPFTLSTPVESGSYVLSRSDDSNGVYKVIFSDTTRLPGRFTISIAGSILDVMPKGVIFDQREFQWVRLKKH